MVLSEHFYQNWQRRIGGRPTLSMVHRIVAEAVRVQAGMEITTDSGRKIRIPSLYWHPGRRLFISLDTVTDVCITVVNESCI